jgi:gamma-glutamylcyclotransferase (GGCT)/AIG2-like uncharacterized protein YtfP
VYEVENIEVLDAYEGYNERWPENSLFIRKQVSATKENGSTIECWIYLFNQSLENAKLIPSGDWLDYQQKRRVIHGTSEVLH